jgi:outer membrane protein OmpA-like peptidoglycan-associated protein
MTAGGVSATLAAAILAGCGGSGGATSSAAELPPCLALKKPVALAIGARSNSPMPVLSAAVTSVVNNAINAEQQVTVVRLDGNPHVVFSQAFNPQGANSESRKTDYNQYVSNLNQILQGTQQPGTDIRAQTPQADVLGALGIAASEVPPGGNVVLMDSGLQTTAPLDFASGLLNDDPQTIADYLKHAGELPNLKGRRIYFVSLGWTAAPQPALGVRYRDKIQQIWADIARDAQASCVGFDNSADTQNAVPGRPRVTVVTPPPPQQPPAACGVIDLGDANHVGFDFDSTTFRDPAGARATLQKLANVMLRTGESVKLTGSTSSEGSNGYNLWLSRRRAEAVKAMLVQLNVPASRITTFGDGSHLPGRLNDRGPHGQLLIGPAIQDRKVVARLTGAGCHAK